MEFPLSFPPALPLGAFQPVSVSNLLKLGFRRSFTKFFTAILTPADRSHATLRGYSPYSPPLIRSFLSEGDTNT